MCAAIQHQDKNSIFNYSQKLFVLKKKRENEEALSKGFNGTYFVDVTASK
jgi:hypothetical protein